MAWQTIAASETDANSPLNQTLMDKIRGDLDHLGDNSSGHSHSGAAAGEGPKIHQGGLQTSIQEASVAGMGPGEISGNYTLSSVGGFGFWPQIKVDDALYVNSLDVRVLFDLDTAPETYTPYIHLKFNITLTVYRTLYAGVRYIQATRDEPIVWLLRKKSTGEIMGSVFDPEGKGNGHPFADFKPGSDMEVLALELKRDDNLRFHLFKHLMKYGLLWQIQLGLALGAIRIKDETSSIGDIPCLKAGDIKIMDFDFDLKR